MRVLLINSVCGYGSTGRITLDIYKLLQAQGHECVVAYGRGTAPIGVKSIKIGKKIDNYMHVAKTRLLDRHGFGSSNATKEFIKYIEEFNPDIIHLHNIHGYYLNVEMLFNYFKKLNKPIIWTLHDCWAFTGHCSYFDFVNCEKWKQGCNNCPISNSYPASLFVDNSANNFIDKRSIFTGIRNLTIVSPSKWLADLCNQSFLRDYPVNVINNGIDLNVFKPVESNFKIKYSLVDKFIILGVASGWDNRKGFEYFIKLAGRIDLDSVIVMVGLTEKQKKKLPPNVIGITRTENISQLAEIYSIADVFINPTLEDNFPTTNLEALACGTPVITFNTGGSVESVDTETGYIVKKGSVEELLSKVTKIKKIGKSSYSTQCRKKASSLYNKDDRFRDYIELYYDIFLKHKL